ncbi:hypothetical protein ISN44_As06g034920 [Arabidopsis suecica]|uniref:Uncharacterized protein n=1 Tax=Arabidopsis suecica TaxID=45249 RepID=A0A8T2CLU0_ARASU|nr:hypothetical protein ISN44_As06g034920 [Arabidopsis suecica]
MEEENLSFVSIQNHVSSTGEKPIHVLDENLKFSDFILRRQALTPVKDSTSINKSNMESYGFSPVKTIKAPIKETTAQGNVNMRRKPLLFFNSNL